jgi:hypothetical protein
MNSVRKFAGLYWRPPKGFVDGVDIHAGCTYQDVKQALTEREYLNGGTKEKWCLAQRRQRKNRRNNDAEARTRMAQRIWEETVNIQGTLAERYLHESRRRVASGAGAGGLRFYRELWYRSDDPARKIRIPALVAAMRNILTGKVAAAHTTFMEPSTPMDDFHPRPIAELRAELTKLDQGCAFASGAIHPIGHNFLSHDLEHPVAAKPALINVFQAPIDTLWLNPLAFPRNPYHHLVKHYHDGRLATGHINDPELDAQMVFEVLANQIDAFEVLSKTKPDALVAYHFLTTGMERSRGFDALFRYLRGAQCPDQDAAFLAMQRLLKGHVCALRLKQTLGRLKDLQNGWPMAYAISWITVAGGDSVMPPWVRAQFRESSLIVSHLRDTSCKDPSCEWCVEQNDPVRALSRWFGFESFRQQPVDFDGRPLQERIVDEAMSGQSLLGLLPTGTGKSDCYQVPALSRFDNIGALTVVISPLVALMSDQVQGMERSGISCAVTINGTMSMPERQNALDKVRLGDSERTSPQCPLHGVRRVNNTGACKEPLNIAREFLGCWAAKWAKKIFEARMQRIDVLDVA